MKRILLVLAVLCLPSLALAQGGNLGSNSSPVTNRLGLPIPGANIAICQPLATTAASVTSNLAVLTMSSNPITAGFVAGMTIQVAGFTGGDTYFNGGTFTNGTGITGGFTILSVTSTTITYSLTHANASAATNGTVLQQGNPTTSCAGLSTITSDPALVNTLPQPLTSDGLGNWNAFAAAGVYYAQFYGSGITTKLLQYATACVPSSATGTCGVYLNGNNAWTGNETHAGTEHFAGGGSTDALTAGSGITAGNNTWTGQSSFSGAAPALYVATAGNGGSDSNDCLAAAVGGGHGPCLTVQHTCQVALAYVAGGSNITVNIGTGSFAGFQLAGFNAGNAGAGLNNLLLINGNGSANTTLTAYSSTNIVATASSGLQVELQNITLSASGASQYDIFAQNPGTIVTLGPSLTLSGAASAAAAMHVEAGAYIQSSGNPTTTFNGSFAAVITAGPAGFLQLGNTLACSSLTFAQEFALVDAAQLNLFATTTFSGCGAVTGNRYYVRGNGLIANLSGANLPGNAPGLVDTGGRYRPTPTLTITTSTGLGTGGTATIQAGSGSHGGIITLNTGNPGMAATGLVAFLWQEYQVITSNPILAACTASPVDTGTSWNSQAVMAIALNSTGAGFEIAWSNNAVALTANSSYLISYTCNGDF